MEPVLYHGRRYHYEWFTGHSAPQWLADDRWPFTNRFSWKVAWIDHMLRRMRLIRGPVEVRR